MEHLCCSEVSISPLFRWPNSVCHFIISYNTRMLIDVNRTNFITVMSYNADACFLLRNIKSNEGCHGGHLRYHMPGSF
ncbi:hypothetical protein EH207_16565 [Brenneria rubrifaciens]|uniref:Uncharacterized protein n=1 Tax=Brenneria rubrifaciens TaxID=55213 RepID=A0A4P8QS24_9GAMM|nr:hypothetical protein EH207_16565 [Brenneria rubrifaciens]